MYNELSTFPPPTHTQLVTQAQGNAEFSAMGVCVCGGRCIPSRHPPGPCLDEEVGREGEGNREPGAEKRDSYLPIQVSCLRTWKERKEGKKRREGARPQLLKDGKITGLSFLCEFVSPPSYLPTMRMNKKVCVRAVTWSIISLIHSPTQT